MQYINLSAAPVSGLRSHLTISNTVININMQLKYTPENITSLDRDEVFVFGSNLAGNHAGGAARVARERFGAIMGQGVGMQGQSYAIPSSLMSMNLSDLLGNGIRPHSM